MFLVFRRQADGLDMRTDRREPAIIGTGLQPVTIMYAPISFLPYLHGPTAALPCTILAIFDSCSYL
jgi:hypothetical protein